jgi:hypothetical protein
MWKHFGRYLTAHPLGKLRWKWWQSSIRGILLVNDGRRRCERFEQYPYGFMQYEHYQMPQSACAWSKDTSNVGPAARA